MGYSAGIQVRLRAPRFVDVAKIILVTPTGSSSVLARRALFRPAPPAQLAVVLNSTEGRIHVRTHFSVVLISTENEKE